MPIATELVFTYEWHHAAFRKYQMLRQAELSKHYSLSGGTQSRALPRHQIEKSLNILFSRVGIEPTSVSLTVQ